MGEENLMLRYVMQRGLVEPGVDGREELMKSDYLAELAGIWRDHKKAILALLKARIYPIERELVGEAMPYEVLFLRQAMVEVAFIGDDLEAYAQEYERRKKEPLPSYGQGLSPPVGSLEPDNNTVDNGVEPEKDMSSM